jgi:PAS domain S-box-containing protein
MTASPQGLGADALRAVFPFHLTVDRELAVVQVGQALSRVCPDVVPGSPLSAHVRIVRPEMALAFETLVERRRSLFVLEVLPRRLPLRGQMLVAPDGDTVTFLGSPWVTDLEQLATFGLALTDFPAHEPIADYLFLLQSQQTALKDARDLAARLEAQTRVLRETVEALNEKESTLRAVVDTAADGIITIDAAGLIRSFNAAASRIFGYEPDEVVGRNVAVLMPRDGGDEHDRSIARYVATGEARIIGTSREVEGLRKDGTRVPLHLSVSDVAVGPQRLFTGILRDLTPERRAAADLQASEMRLQKTLTAVHAGVWDWDLTTDTGYWSEQNYRLIGLEPGSVAPSPEVFFACIHPDDVEASRELMRRALEGEVPLESEHRILLPDGSIRHMRDMRVVLRDEAGVATGISGITIDITATRRAELERDAEREKSARIVGAQYEVARVLAAATDSREAMTRTLETLGRLLQWDWGAFWVPREEHLACDTVWARPEADFEGFLQTSRETRFAVGEGLPGRVWASGDPTWLADLQLDENFPRRPAAAVAGLHSAFALPVLTRGTVIGVIEFFSAQRREADPSLLTSLSALSTQLGDFMERLDGERRLRESEARMRLIVDTSLDGVISMDGAGVVTLWSPQAASIFGWSAEEAVGRLLNALIVPERLRDAHRAGMARYLATGERRVLGKRIEVPALHKDGHEFPIELAIEVADGGLAAAAGGDPSRLVFSAFVRDITLRRQAEADLRKAKDDAEAASRARAEFLAMMSHELRTPLHGVIGMLDLLRDTPLAEEQRRQLDVARRSARSLVAITNDILDFSKIAAGRLVIEPHPFDLGRLVEEVAATFRPQADASGVAVRVAWPEGRLSGVLGDSVRVGQILTNLVGNAVKFTPSGHVGITVRRETDAGAPSPVVVCEVEDTGVGIPEGKREVIFDAFAQADASTTRRFGGTGLGLPISARLAEAMAGSLTLASSSERGSRFRLELPLPPAELTDDQAAGEAGAPSAVPARVLLVEDHVVNQEIASAMLGALGCKVTVAADGVQALEAIAREPFDIVFMDCLMPNMDGYEASRAIRALGHDKVHLPIIAMTASAFPEDRARAFDAGMNDHLTKPTLDGALRRALAQWLPRTPAPLVDADKVEAVRLLAEATMVGWASFLGRFIDDMEQAMDRLDRALEEGTAEALRAEAHAMRRASGMMGTPRLEGACADLEQACQDGAASRFTALVATISAEVDAAVAALRAHRGDAPPA